MSQETWLDGIRRKRRKKAIRALVFVVAAEALWLGLCAVGIWLWTVVFHRLPPAVLTVQWLVGLGSAIIVPLSAIAPLAPMKGPDAEVMAADEFFKEPPR